MQSPNLILLSQQKVLQRAMDVIANNVANASTTGFKRQGIEFDTLLARPAPDQTLNFVVDRATYRDTGNGAVTPTGNPLDFAISGNGYFQVRTPEGTRYTRGGGFQLDTQGQIVNLSGYPILGDGGQPITIPDTVTDLNVSGDGFITAKTDNGTSLAELGKISVVKFGSEQALRPEGGGLYATEQAPTPAVESFITQGALEQSNVSPVTEMTTMIQIMRAYEQTTNMIAQQNQRLTNAINTLSKTTA